MKAAALSVVALVKSLWADRLRDADFEKLSGAASGLSAVSVLSNMPAYRGCVGSSANPLTVGEDLKSALWADIRKISRYSHAAGRDFIDYFIFRTDVEALSDAIAALHASTNDYALSFSAGYKELSRLDLIKTAGARDLKELIKSAGGTRYEGLLKDVLKDYISSGDIIRVEAGLSRAADIRFLEVSGGKKRGADVPSAAFRKTGLFRLRAAESDLALIKHCARAALFDVPQSARLAIASPVITALPEGKLAALAALDDPGKLSAVLAGTDYSGLDTSDLETSAENHLADILYNTLVYSFDPDELVFAYILSKKAEIGKITGTINHD